MLLKISVVLVVVFVAIVTGGESNKWPKPTTSTTTTTPFYTTLRWTTTRPPKPGPITPLCCTGPNEIYLAPGVAPYCQVYCEDIGKPCHMRYDIPEPFGCYCAPGFCRNKKAECIPFSLAFIKCHWR